MWIAAQTSAARNVTEFAMCRRLFDFSGGHKPCHAVLRLICCRSLHRERASPQAVGVRGSGRLTRQLLQALSFCTGELAARKG